MKITREKVLLGVIVSLTNYLINHGFRDNGVVRTAQRVIKELQAQNITPELPDDFMEYLQEKR